MSAKGSEMAKFKVGDRVRRMRTSRVPWQFGDVGVEYTVLDVDRLGNIQIIANRPCAESAAFELVTPATSSPICTVERREIVPGTYGDVTVYDSGYVVTRSLRGATSLREAARIFNEIADVLDENAKEKNNG